MAEQTIGQVTRRAINHFCQQPIENMPVSVIPGIGATTELKLRQEGIVTALDLYSKLETLDFNENNLRDFIKEKCALSKPRTPVIYKALMKWHRQFGAPPPPPPPRALDSRSGKAEHLPVQCLGRGGTRRAAAAGKRPRISSVRSIRRFESPDRDDYNVVGSTDDANFMSNASSVTHSIFNPSQPNPARWNPLQYLATYSHIFSNIPEKFEFEFMLDIMNIAEKYKNIQRQQQNEPQASSSAT